VERSRPKISAAADIPALFLYDTARCFAGLGPVGRPVNPNKCLQFRDFLAKTHKTTSRGNFGSLLFLHDFLPERRLRSGVTTGEGSNLT
jgi:hypothetical protein